MIKKIFSVCDKISLFLMRIILLLGSPGSGKGSISQTLVRDYGFHHLSTGGILRARIQNQKESEKGSLVDDDCVNQLFLEALSQYGDDDVVILDGYPRTKVQADFLEKHCKIDIVFLLTDISDEYIIKRLSSRVLCRAKDHSFNLLYRAPKVPGICDFDGSELYRRPDDEGEIIKKRLRIYREHTQPLIDYYREKSEFIEIDAKRNMEEMVEEIYGYIKRLK